MYRSIYDERQRQWNGIQTCPIYNSESTLGEVLLKSMQVNGSKIAQVSDDTGVRLTFGDIRERTIRAALNLRKRGYQAGQIFTIIAKHSEHFAPIVLAAFCIGCPINVLDTTFQKNEIKHMMSITSPSLVLCDADIHDKAAECLQELGNEAKIITFNGKVSTAEQVEDLLLETEGEALFAPTRIDGKTSIAAIMCSSGTTGLPKGVSLSHTAILAAQANFEFVRSDDVLLCFSQLYWITGVMTMVWSTLYGATRIITTETFSAELIFRLISQYRISFILNSLNQMLAMLKHEKIADMDLTSIKNYCLGGSRIPHGLPAQFNKYFPDGAVHIILGMTETCGVYAMACTKNVVDKEPGGQLTYNVGVKIIDDDGNRCGVGIDGEICLKLRYDFLGYYNNREATEQAFDAEGFFLTGDIGHFDADGDLHIVDRKKDMMKYCGYQVTPTEIEAVLIKSPEIEAVCVVGIPDSVASDLPAVAVIRKAGANITADDIYSLVADNLADKCKLRGGVYFVDALPITASGKILRRKVKETLIQLYKAEHAAN